METNIIYNEECISGMKKIPDNSIDMILCDLPYGVTDCKWDNIIPFNVMWREYHRVAKINAAIVLFSVQPFTTKLIASNMKYFKYCWYWKKNNITGSAFSKVQPMRCVEDICVFYKKLPKYNPQGLVKLEKVKITQPKKCSIYEWRGKNPSVQQYTNYPKNILYFDGVNSKERQHPTQKPLELIEYLIKTYTDENDIVLDNCMGSGTTAAACINTNRKYIGFETDKKYFEAANERIEKVIREKEDKEKWIYSE